MFIANCFAYADIGAEIGRQQESFVIRLNDANKTLIHLTLSYSQARALADGLSAMLNQALIKELVDSNRGHILGDMAVSFIPEGAEKVCLPNILPAQTGEKFLSRSV